MFCYKMEMFFVFYEAREGLKTQAFPVYIIKDIKPFVQSKRLYEIVKSSLRILMRRVYRVRCTILREAWNFPAERDMGAAWNPAKQGS